MLDFSPLINDALDEAVQNTGGDSVPAAVRPWLAVGIGLAAVVLITIVLFLFLNYLLRHRPLLRIDVARSRLPLFLVLSCGVSFAVLKASGYTGDGAALASFLLVLGLIGSIAALLIVLLGLLEDVLMARYRSDLENPRRVAKLRTQVGLLRRVGTALILVLAVSGALLTIPEVRALGAGLLASAGLISVVAGLAVQSTLSNVFAGLQIAFTDAIRVDDTVVVETQRGVIEEITLTYVVVLMPDGRRMILPSTYFTTTPFENWSRKNSEISGSVMLDLNWNAPIEHLRARLVQLLDATELWDGRNGSLSVADAVGGTLNVSIFVSARNAGDLIALKSFLREKMIAELQEKYPEALPVPQAMRRPAV